MNIVFGLDQSKYSKSAMEFFRHIQFPPRSNAYLVHVTQLSKLTKSSSRVGSGFLPSGLKVLREKAKTQAEAFVARMGKNLRGEDLTIQGVVVEGKPGEEIIKAIGAYKASLVVVGSRGLSKLKRFFLGSVSEWVLRDAPCSVMISRPTAKQTKTDRVLKIIVAVDGSQDSMSSVDLLNSFQFTAPTKIVLLHVVRKHVYETEQVLVADSKHREEFAQMAERLLEEQGREGVKILSRVHKRLSPSFPSLEERLAYGHEAHEILKAARHTRADLIIVGSRGLTRMRNFFLGSVSEKVVHHAPCSVLVSRPAKTGPKPSKQT